MRILAVDDSFNWLNVHTYTITEVFGTETDIICVNSAFKALNIYKEEFTENCFDLIITDMQMEFDFEPLYAGEWLIKEIQNLNSKQNILIVSSTLNIEQIANSYNVNCLSKRYIISNPKVYKDKLKNILP